MSPRAHPVLIAGCGIGGLAAVLGLAREGFRSILLEKASSLGELGAGIQLGPNAFHVPARASLGCEDSGFVEVPP